MFVSTLRISLSLIIDLGVDCAVLVRMPELIGKPNNQSLTPPEPLVQG